MLMTFTDAICAGTRLVLAGKNVHIFGLGVSYSNGADGTTKGLNSEFPGQLHDTPVSEAAITGMAVGMAISGLRPIVHHGRIEFAFYGMDAIVTQASNWNYMFGGNYPCPLTVRVAIGRQWGNGPQHTRSGRGIFAVPGLKVVVPSIPSSAKGLLISAVRDNNPVIYLEHRWLYKLKGTVLDELISQPLDKAQVLREGKHITIVAVGDMVFEALRAANWLRQNAEIAAEVVDIVSLYPMDKQTILASIAKTGKALVVDAATPAFSVAHEVMALAMGAGMLQVQSLTCPDVPCPTAPALAGSYYPTWVTICNRVTAMLQTGSALDVTHSFEDLHIAPSLNIDDLLSNSE